jgi:hypothetical protein
MFFSGSRGLHGGLGAFKLREQRLLERSDASLRRMGQSSEDLRRYLICKVFDIRR